MIELEFVVWEFVRVMVELERVGEDSDAGVGVYSAWFEAWRELDHRLTELGNTDAEGFSNLMMEQTVAVPCASARQLAETVGALTRITGALEREIKKVGGDAARIDELEFERTELQGLIARLGGIEWVA
jgi:hypothetical protein